MPFANFITNQHQFQSIQNRYAAIFNKNEFPAFVFQRTYCRYVFFDNALICRDQFYSAIFKLFRLDNVEDTCHLLMVEPDPALYYSKYNVYGCIEILNSSKSDNISCITNDSPIGDGGSIQALGDRYVAFDVMGKFAAFSDHNYGLGVLAMSDDYNKQYFEVLLESDFVQPSDIESSLNINHIDEHAFCHQLRENYCCEK